MVKQIKKIVKMMLVSALMVATLGTGALAQAAGPGGPGNGGRGPGDGGPRMEQRHMPPPPQRHNYRHESSDNGLAGAALGIAVIAAAIAIHNSN